MKLPESVLDGASGQGLFLSNGEVTLKLLVGQQVVGLHGGLFLSNGEVTLKRRALRRVWQCDGRDYSSPMERSH